MLKGYLLIFANQRNKQNKIEQKRRVLKQKLLLLLFSEGKEGSDAARVIRLTLTSILNFFVFATSIFSPIKNKD